MANPEHLKILKQGVKAWNKWREANSGIKSRSSRIKLSGAGLAGACLVDANLSDTNLSGANFMSAQLGGANLSGAMISHARMNGTQLQHANLQRVALWGADLRFASLIGADLRWADLGGSDLTYADLSGANLQWSNLSGVNFNSAELSGANLAFARTNNTIFSHIDMSRAKGLESVVHAAPSSIGIDTIYLSGGNISEVFLRGAGVPEDFIVYMRSLVGKAIEFYSCFISYSSKDNDFAQRLHADLRRKGVRCWFAPEDLKIGDKFRTRIDESIRIYDKLMVVLSENSIRSPWVEEEVEAALEKERKKPGLGIRDTGHGEGPAALENQRTPSSTVLFPITLDDAVMETAQAWAASLRRTRHIGDFRAWKDHDQFQKSFERLLRDLKA